MTFAIKLEYFLAGMSIGIMLTVVSALLDTLQARRRAKELFDLEVDRVMRDTKGT